MSPDIDAYNKDRITQLMCRAVHPMRGGEPEMHNALMLMTTAIDKLLTLIYFQLRDEGLINALPDEPTLRQRCEIVAEIFAAEGVKTDVVNLSTLRELMPILGRVKHSLRPRVERPIDMFGVAQLVVHDLYRYYFGEAFCFGDDDDTPGEPTLYNLPWNELQELQRDRIRHYIAPHLGPEEISIFDLIPEHFVAGIVDSATLRRATGWSNWFEIGSIATIEFAAKLLPATRSEAELIFCEKAVQVVAELRAFVRTEAWSYRARLNIEQGDAQSDVELTLRSLHERMRWWRDDGEEAA
jgi:hypothetical protein